MSLRETLEEYSEPASLPETRGERLQARSARAALKARVHGKLLDQIDLSVVEHMAPEQLKAELKVLVEKLIVDERMALTDFERNQLVQDIQNEVMGLGPIEPLLCDPGISDILVNGSAEVYVERNGRLELTPIHFNDDQHLLKIIGGETLQNADRVRELLSAAHAASANAPPTHSASSRHGVSTCGASRPASVMLRPTRIKSASSESTTQTRSAPVRDSQPMTNGQTR